MNTPLYDPAHVDSQSEMPPDVPDLAVKLSAVEQDELAVMLCQKIEAAIQQQGQLPLRWEQLEKDYSNQPSGGGVELIPGQQPRHLNITQPRIDKLVGSVAGPLSAQEPFYVAKAYNQEAEQTKEAEDTVQFLLRVASYERHLRVATRIACMAEPAIYKFMVQADDELADDIETEGTLGDQPNKVVPRIDVIHPKDFVIYPAAVAGIKRALIVGHRFWHTKEEIEDLMDAGEYIRGDVAPIGENPQEDEAGRRMDWSLTEETAGISDPEDQMIRCYELIFRHKMKGDKKRIYYRAIIAFRQKMLLKVEKYLYSKPWYFGHYLHEEYQAFYSANPVAQNIQEHQRTFNDLINLCLDGSMMNAFPAGFTNSRMLHQEFVKYEHATVYQVDGNPDIHWTKAQFDPSIMPQLMELVQDLSDSAVRISQAGMGQEFKTGMTATEASGILQGQNAGLDEYRANASTSGAQLCDFVRECAYIHHADLAHTFGDSYPCKNPGVLKDSLMWEANGKTSENLPQAIIGKLQALMAFIGPLAQALQQQGVQVNLFELAKTFLDSLGLPVDTSKILQEPKPSNGPPGANPQDIQQHLMALLSASAGSGGAGMPAPSLPAQPPQGPMGVNQISGPL